MQERWSAEFYLDRDLMDADAYDDDDDDDDIYIMVKCMSVCLYVVKFPNCIVYSWVYNTQKTVKFDFDCFHSLD